MSYHTHHLRDGDIFAAPTDLDVYANNNWIGLPYHMFEVIDVEHSTYVTPAPDYRHLSGLLDKNGWNIHLVARCLSCDEILNAVVSKEISLCMIGYGPEDGEPAYLEQAFGEPVETIEHRAARWDGCEAVSE